MTKTNQISPLSPLPLSLLPHRRRQRRSTYVSAAGTNNELTSDSNWTYTYDDEGNRISKQNSTNRELYEWDYRNRLTSVTQQTYDTTQTIEYTYDYNNVWIRKTVGTNSTIFIPENYQTVLQIDNNTITHHYLWTPQQQDKLLADTTTSGILWSLTDHLGTICDIIGTADAHLIYDAFGNLIFGTNPILFGYTGKAFDVDTQLQNNINRWFDTTIGRWLSTDPVGFNGNDTNLYRYVKNAVLKFLDALGRELISSSNFNPILWETATTPLPSNPSNSDNLEIISQPEDLTFENAANPNPLVAIVTFERSKCWAERTCEWLKDELPQIQNLLTDVAMTLVVEAPRIRNTSLENLGAEKRNLILQMLGTATNTNVLNDALALEQFSRGECFTAIKSVVIGHLSPQKISAALNVKDSVIIIIKEDQINREYENTKAQGEEVYKRRNWY